MYLCAFHASGESLDRTRIGLHLARLRELGDTDPTVVTAGPFAAALPGRPTRFAPAIVRLKHLVACGVARLDNRLEVARLGGAPDAGTDLELIVRALDECGEKCISSLLGDFAFVLWDPRAHKLIAARDAFGVKPLYHRRRDDVLLFSDRMDALASDGAYDVDYIGHFLTGLVDPGVRTIWSDVRSVPPGGFLLQRGTVLGARRYWSPEDFTAEPGEAEPFRTEQFLEALREGVSTRMGPAGATWAQLSGGVDSSSVVALAQSSAAPGLGLAGTFTLADTLGGGDERRYADSVIRRYGVRNERLLDYWGWQDDDEPPPATDGPSPLYPFYARDRRTAEVLRHAGARVLLSGFGSDHYLTGNPGYITDLAASGKVATALRELTQWSIMNRESFWTLAARHLITPMLAPRRTNDHAVGPLPAWLDEGFARDLSLAARTADASARGGQPGRMFARKLCRDIASIPAWIDRWPYGDDIEVRYPFLHRPLVELSLRLPAALRIRPPVTKWVLRESMRGLLPEEVRTRSTKGMIDARILWSLEHERERIDGMLKDPILAQIGCITPDALRKEVDAARRGVPANLVMLMSALALETWLSVRSNRWTGTRANKTAA